MKKIISALMAGIILATSFEATMPAAAEAVPQQTEQTLSTGNMEISGTTNIGSLLAETMSEGYQELTENEGYSVFSIEMKDKTARVSLQAVKSCTLLVGLYDNTGAEMLTITSADIEADQRTADAVFDIEQMPEYYFLRAFLIDTDTHRALSEKYECPLYTQKWQEFFSKTTDDFEPERVYNLDNDKTTNFGVFSDDITVFSDETDVNKLVSYDNDKYVYVVENADESITSLTKGETVIFPIDNNDIVIVTVSSMSANGTTVVIQGSKPDLNNVFSYLRVEGQDDLEGAEVDTSEVPEFVQFDGIGDATCVVDSDTGAVSEILSDEEAANKSDGDPWTRTKTIEYTFKSIKEYEKENEHFKLNGTISGKASIWMETTMDYNINGKDSFFELKTDYSNKCTFGVEGSIEGDIPLGEIPFTPVPGVTISIKFYFCASAEGSINLELSYDGTIGYRLEHGEATNLSNQPQLHVKLEIAATVFIGLKLKFAISLLEITDDIKLGEIGVTARAGIEISGSMAYAPKENSEERHSCISCINGTWGFVVAVGVEGTIANIKELTFSDEIKIPAFPTYDFYYSLDFGDHSISSKCPHKEYRITAYVHTTKNGKQVPVSGALISEEAHKLAKSTYFNGYITFYLEPGSYFFKAVKEDYTKGLKNIVIKQATALDFEIEPVTGTINGFQYSVDSNNYATIVKYVGNQTLVKIPETIGGAPVTAIGYRAFMNSSVEGIQFNEGLKSIGNQAFLNCTRLRTVAFSKTITTVASNAFSGCKNIVTASFAKDTKKIPNYAMNGCSSLKNVEIPRTVTEIGNYAFSGTALEMFLIHNGVKTLGNGAFANCKSLKKVSIPATLTSAGSYSYSPFSGCSALTDIIFDKGITKIPANLLKDCTGITKITIPSTVQTIGDSAFQNAGLTSIALPSSLKQIGRFAFSGIQIETLTLPEGVQSISDGAFSDCKSLKSVTIPTTLTTSGYYSYPPFSGCPALTNVTFNKGITQIPKYLLKDCTSITKITIPSTVQTIGDSAFQGSGLTSLSLPSSIKQIGRFAFSGIQIETLTLPEGVQSISDGAFSDCKSLKSVTIPTTLTTSGYYSYPPFSGCPALTNVSFNKGITQIPENLLKDCTSITKITIPSTVQTVGSRAFQSTGLTSIVLPSSLKQIGAYAFLGTKIETLVLPEGVQTIGNGAFGSCHSLKSVTIPKTLTSVGSYRPIFADCTALTDVTFNNGITDIPGYLLEDCTGLTNITIPSTVKTIGHSAFSGTGLTSISLPSSLNKIVDYAFYGTKIETLVLPEGVEKIGDRAFGNCKFLKSVTIPTTLTTAGYSSNPPFSGCTALTDVTFNNGITKIPSFLLNECNGITKITIPSTVKTIGIGAFCDTGLSAVSLPSGLTKIENSAFNGSKLTTVTIPAGVTSIGSNAFANCSLLSFAVINGEKTTVGSKAFNNCSSSLVIACYAGSPAETYAKNNNIKYSTIGDASYSSDQVIYDYPDEEFTDPDSDLTNDQYTDESTSQTEEPELPTIDPIVYESYWDFEDLTAGETYNFYAVVSREAESLFAPANMLYIEQFTADENGCASVGYMLARDIVPEVFVVQMSPYDISDADISVRDMVCTGDTLIPSVKVMYEDTELQLGIDYDVSGEYLVTEAGTYSLTIKGLDNYGGTAGVSYNVLPAEQKTVVAIEIVTEPLKKEYYIGQQFTGFGGRLKLYYDNNYEEETEFSSDMVAEFNSETAGEKTVIVNVGDADAEFTVTVVEKDKNKPFVTAEAGNGRVKLSWTAVENAEKYSVFQYGAEGFEEIAGDITDTTFTVDSLANDTEYMFAVKAYVNGGWTELSAADYTAATPFVDISPKPVAIPGDGEVKLKWEAIPDAEMYSVSIVNETEISPCVSDLTATEYVVKELTNGTEYKFLVRAFVNGEWSRFSESNYVSATPAAALKVTNVRTEPMDGAVKVTWDSLDGAEMYRVYKYLNDTYTRVFTGNASATSTVVNDLTNGTRYGFAVTAKVNGAWTVYSELVYEIPVSENTVLPPQNVAAAAGDGQVTISWDAVANAEMYRVFTVSDAVYKRVYSGDAGKTTTVITGLTNGVEYGFAVTAKANGIWSDYSEIAYATPVAVVKPTIIGYKVGDAKVKLQWSPINGAEMYRVYYYLDGVYTRAFTASSETTVATVTGLTGGTEYGFVVSAKVNGTWTNYTDKADLVYATPTGTAKPSIVAYKAGNYKVKLEWKPVDGAEMYRVYTYENGNYTRKFTCSGSRNIATVTGLVSGVKYGFVVSAKVNGTWTNYTDASDLVYTAPTGTPAPVITGYKTGDSKVKLEWYALDGAEMYRVYSLLNGVYKREFTTTGSTVATVSDLTNGQEYGFVVSAKVNGVWTGYKVPELILYATPNA